MIKFCGMFQEKIYMADIAEIVTKIKKIMPLKKEVFLD